MSHQIQYFFVPQGDNGNNRRRRVINSHATRHVRRQKRKATIDSALVPKKTLGSYTECNTLSGPCEFDEIRTDLRSVRHDDFALRVQQPAWHTRTLDEQELLVNLNKFCESSKERISKKAQKWLDTLKLFLQMTFEYEFVMDAALAWSAAHLKKSNVEQETQQQLIRHQLRAIQGLQKAIANFSSTNADAIVAASVLLAWQSANSSDWFALVMGIKDVSYQIKLRRFESNIVLDDSFDCDTEKKIVDIHPLVYGSDHFNTHYSMLLHILSGLFKDVRDSFNLVLFRMDIVTVVEQTETLIRDRVLLFPTKSVRLRAMLSQLPLDHTNERISEPEELLVLAYLHALNAMWATNQDWKGSRYNGLFAVAIEECYENLCGKLSTGSAGMQERCRKALNSMGLALKISWMVRPFSSRLKKYEIELDENGRISQGPLLTSIECNMKPIEVMLDFPEGVGPASVYENL